MDNFKHPPLIWYQNKMLIVIDIEIRDIENEKIEFKENELLIEISTKEDTYKETLILNDKINPIKCKYSKTDYHLTIEMYKANTQSWSSLSNNDKNYNVKVNWNNFKDSDDEDTISEDPFKDNDSDDIPDKQ